MQFYCFNGLTPVDFSTILRSAFCQFPFASTEKLQKSILYKKICPLNVGKIDTWSQSYARYLVFKKTKLVLIVGNLNSDHSNKVVEIQ